MSLLKLAVAAAALTLGWRFPLPHCRSKSSILVFLLPRWIRSDWSAIAGAVVGTWVVAAMAGAIATTDGVEGIIVDNSLRRRLRPSGLRAAFFRWSCAARILHRSHRCGTWMGNRRGAGYLNPL
jgi:hypothetical protein